MLIEILKEQTGLTVDTIDAALTFINIEGKTLEEIGNEIKALVESIRN